MPPSRLKYLNLENNEIASIPHLRLLGGRLRHKDDANELVEKQSSVKFTTDKQESQSEEEGKEMTYEDKEGNVKSKVAALVRFKTIKLTPSL